MRTANGIAYVSGGLGEEARTAINQLQPGFGLKLVFSDASGEYLVADHVAVNGRGGEVFDVDGVGPMLLVKLGPGNYTVAASYQGKTEVRAVQIGAAATRTVTGTLPATSTSAS